MADVTSQYDIVVVGGGPAGLSAALWAARYRRSVLLVDAGEQRNRRALESHGYFGLDGISPGALLERARTDLLAYPTVEFRSGVRAASAAREAHSFVVGFDRIDPVTAARLVVAPGVRDIFPDIENFFDHYGVSVFSCPSCDGYESQGKNVLVIGHSGDVAGFALGLLDWARTITVVTNGVPFEGDEHHRAALDHHGIRLLEENVVRLVGKQGDLGSAMLGDGVELPCESAFFSIGHQQRHELFDQLGCQTNDEGCVVVDDDHQTTVRDVFAAGDVTPGPHLIQVAAAEGAVAGVAAAQSLRGEWGAPRSPTPAPDPEEELEK